MRDKIRFKMSSTLIQCTEKMPKEWQAVSALHIKHITGKEHHLGHLAVTEPCVTPLLQACIQSTPVWTI